MTPSTVAVVQARMGSTRLPGKVLRPLGGRPVLEWVVRAARRSAAVDEVIVATTGEAADGAVVALAEQLGVAAHRGPTDDVLARFVGALDGRSHDVVVRLTADCPLLDPRLIDAVCATLRTTEADYASTVTPRCLPRGLDVEAVTTRALHRVDRRATAHHRVHVTSLVYSEPTDFEIVGVTVHPAADDLRVTLDTEADASLLEALVARLGDAPPRWQDVVAVLRDDPELVALNADVVQKALVEG